MFIITHSEVRELLTMRECMEVVGEALTALARGDGVQPLRDGFLLPALTPDAAPGPVTAAATAPATDALPAEVAEAAAPLPRVTGPGPTYSAGDRAS